MISEFVFSAEGMLFLKDFKKMFDCTFRIDEPDGSDVVMDTSAHSYRISDKGGVDEFKAAIEASVKTGENRIAKLYAEIEYNDEVLY